MPLAANAAPDVISFTLVTVGGVVSTGQEGLYDELTGYGVCEPTGTPMDQVIDQLKAAGPSGFDPRPSVEALTQPGLWVYGGNDLSHPTVLSVEILEEVDEALGKDWTIEVSPTANHELIENGEICQADGPPAEDVLSRISEWVARVVGSEQ